MSRKIIINGGRPLKGGVLEIPGSPNQVTKAIMASILTKEVVIIKGVPDVNEVKITLDLYKDLGGDYSYLEEDVLKLDSKNISNAEVDQKHCTKNRISILSAGPLLHRFKTVKLSKKLGGDQIGERPVNYHIEGLKKFGVQVDEDDENYFLKAPDAGMKGCHISLPFPSVMTTENLLIVASLAKGRTIIENAAIEPEIIELTKMLQKMGANIMRLPNRTYIVEGVSSLKGCELRLMFDRNQAASFAVAAIATGGNVWLHGVTHDPIFSFINFIQKMGCEFKINSKGLYVSAPKKSDLKSSHIEVDVHPGFMTDWQQPFMVLFTQANGVSILHETVFENRLLYTNFLNEMGAKITLSSNCLGELPCRFRNQNYIHSAIIQGPTELQGGEFTLPTDLRAGKCLVVAGLVAKGITTLKNIEELERKYDRLVPRLESMGADIKITS